MNNTQEEQPLDQFSAEGSQFSNFVNDSQQNTGNQNVMKIGEES